MELEKQILGDLMEKRISAIEKIIGEAFLEHFGFSLQDVQDKDELDRVVDPYSTIESFRYRGETFLYWNREMDIKFDSNKDGADITLTTQFKKV